MVIAADDIDWIDVNIVDFGMNLKINSGALGALLIDPTHYNFSSHSRG